MDTLSNLSKAMLKKSGSTLKTLNECLQSESKLPVCEACGYGEGVHAAWCELRHAGPDRCPTCKAVKGQPGYLFANVPLKHPDFGKTFPCPTCYDTEITNKVQSQIKGLDKKTFDNFVIMNKTSEDGLDAARKFVDKPVGWLTLYGQHGPGKTHLCAAIANHIGVSKARYFSAADLSNSFFGQANEVVDELQRHPVIILDELDKVHWQTNNGAAWAREQFHRILDHRYRNLETHGLVLATNKPPEWYDGDLLFIQSRMLDQRFECVEMRGDNRPFAGDLG